MTTTTEYAADLITVRGGRSGRKVHLARPTSSVTVCGLWLRASAKLYATGAPRDEASKCVKCYPAPTGETTIDRPTSDRASLIALRFAQTDSFEAADRVAFAAAHRVWTAREIAVAGFAVDSVKVEALVETIIDEAATTVHIIAKGHPTMAEARERVHAAVRRSRELVR